MGDSLEVGSVLPDIALPDHNGGWRCFRTTPRPRTTFPCSPPRPVRAVDHGTGDVAGAVTLGRGVSGTSRIVVDTERGVLVGATFTGPATQEPLHSATVAIAGAVPLDDLWHAVPSSPTVSEVWLRLLEAYGL